MTIRELAAQDNTALLEADGENLTLTDPKGTTYAVKGHFYRIGVSMDPVSGLPVEDNVSAFTVGLSSLVSAGLTSYNRLNEETGWKISGLDAMSEPVSIAIESALLDKTLCQVLIQGHIE